MPAKIGPDDKIGPPLQLPDEYLDKQKQEEIKKYTIYIMRCKYDWWIYRSRGLFWTIWQTREQLKKEDAVDIQIKTTLKELILYFVFFISLLISQ